MIDPTKERTELLSQLAKSIRGRRPGHPINVATLHRWTDRGVRGIKLEFLRQGGLKVSSHEALARFFARLTDPGAPSSPMSSLPPDSPPRSDAQLADDIARAERELIQDGIC